MPHDDACLYPKEISWCFNLGLTNRTKSCRRSSETHTLARYSYVADGYIVVLVSRLDNKGICFIGTYDVTEMRAAVRTTEHPACALFFCKLTWNPISSFFHSNEWHMNDAKIKVSAPVMSKQPLFQLTYQHMETSHKAFLWWNISTSNIKGDRTAKTVGMSRFKRRVKLHSHS